MIVPFQLKPSSKVLIAGCGGGFDVLAAGFPVGRYLERQGHTVFYSSGTFTHLSKVDNAETVERFPHQVKIIDRNRTGPVYFPEKYLCEWYAGNTELKHQVYCYTGHGVQPLKTLFNTIARSHGIEYLFVVDGGSDGILRGDEKELGTPDIDAISVVAGSLCEIPHTCYVLSAFGTERVFHSDVLQRMSELIGQNKVFGITSLLNDETIRKEYINLWEHFCECSSEKSTIMGSIVHSLQGDFGNTTVNVKTVLAPVWVSALTTCLWFMDLESVAVMKTDYAELCATDDYTQAARLYSGRMWSMNFGSENDPRIPI